jgi:hypothetical protein
MVPRESIIFSFVIAEAVEPSSKLASLVKDQFVLARKKT